MVKSHVIIHKSEHIAFSRETVDEKEPVAIIGSLLKYT